MVRSAGNGSEAQRTATGVRETMKRPPPPITVCNCESPKGTGRALRITLRWRGRIYGDTILPERQARILRDKLTKVLGY